MGNSVANYIPVRIYLAVLDEGSKAGRYAFESRRCGACGGIKCGGQRCVGPRRTEEDVKTQSRQ